MQNLALEPTVSIGFVVELLLLVTQGFAKKVKSA
jgi:hypothetical protein